MNTSPTRTINSLFALAAAWLPSLMTTFADTAAQDSFPTGGSPNYSISSPLVGQSPLTPGFKGAWLEAYAGAGSPGVIEEGGLSYPGVTNAGGAVEYAAAGTSGRCGRLLGQSINDGTSQTVYFSFMVKLDAVAASYRAVEFHDGGFADGANRRLQIAVGEDIGSGATSDFTVRLFNNNNNGFAGNLGAADTNTNFFVGKLTLGTANDADRIDIWRNPENLTAEASSTVDFSKFGFNLQFDRVSLARFATEGITVDEIRLGTSWAEVITPSTRDVTFQVNMRVMQRLGKFTPATTDEVRVVGAYWDNFSTGLAPLMTDSDSDGIYTVTVPVLGAQGTNFGGYKFWTNSGEWPDGFETGLDNRTATLGAAATPQTLPADYFRNNNADGLGTYYQWADASGLNLATSESDLTADPDGDTTINRAEFLFGGNPKSGISLPQTLARSGGNLVLTWLQRNDVGATYLLRESQLLDGTDWTTSPAVPTDADQTGVPYGYTRRQATVPIDDPKKFLQITGTLP